MTVSVLWIFLTVPWVGLLCVIVVLTDHTNLLFLCFVQSVEKSIVIGPDMDPEGHQFTLYYFELHSDQIALFSVSNFCHAIV